MTDNVKLPMNKRIERFFCDITGRPFIFVDFQYQFDTETLAVIYDYNNPMLNRIRQAGYDDLDPDDAVRHYIQRVMVENSSMLYNEEYDDDGDYDNDDVENNYIHLRGENK